MPILAEGVVRFIGEKVAAVAAESEEIAEEALELIDVEYEELEPLLDPLEAIEPTARPASSKRAALSRLAASDRAPSNVFVHMKWKKGDVEAGFREADIVVENIFTTKPSIRLTSSRMPASYKRKAIGGADIWACSKVPFALREQVATAFGKGLENFVVHPCYIGGCFGGKGDFMDVPVCYLLSLKSGRPVKMVMDYAEEFLAGNPRHAAIVRVKSGVMKRRSAGRASKWNMSSIAAPTAHSNPKVISSVRRKPPGRTIFPTSLSKRKSSTPTRFPAGTCARRAIRRDSSPTSRKWICMAPPA